MPNLQFWKEPFPNESIEEGKHLLHALQWNIKVNQKEGTWTVHAGHQLLLKTAREEAVEALLYGMALSYSVMPERVLNEFRKTVDWDTEGPLTPE